MPQFVLRMNCEYTHTIEAENEEEAIEAGQNLEAEKWDSHAWSPVEAEEED